MALTYLGYAKLHKAVHKAVQGVYGSIYSTAGPLCLHILVAQQVVWGKLI